jgi:Reverse transcriptase (RNA-dependent DNA polymerase)
VQAVVRLRAEGLGWVARTDVDDCFPSVDVPRVRRLLAALVDDADLLGLVDALLWRIVARPGGSRRLAGLAQGSPLSPLLANLALEQLDDRVRAAGFPIVRYADDVVIAAASRDEAWEAIRVAAGALEEIGMGIGDEDTEVMSFAEGFCFLGEDFGPRYPACSTSTASSSPPPAPSMSGCPARGPGSSRGGWWSTHPTTWNC